MRLAAILAIACLATLAFAGCSGKDKDDGGTTSTSSSSASRSGSASTSSTSGSATGTTTSSTTTSSGRANHAPTGTVSAAINGTSAAFNLTGADEDGDALAWTLAFGDGASTNGTTLPATVRHNYTAVGNRTVNFTVSDGKDSASYEVAVAIAGASGPSLVFIGDVESDCASACELGTPVGSPPVPLPGSKGCIAFASDMPGLDCIWTELDAGLAGKAFTLVSTAGDPDVQFLDTCSHAEGADAGTFYNAGPEAGAVPAGAGCAVLWEFNEAPSTLTFTVA